MNTTTAPNRSCARRTVLAAGTLTAVLLAASACSSSDAARSSSAAVTTVTIPSTVPATTVSVPATTVSVPSTVPATSAPPVSSVPPTTDAEPSSTPTTTADPARVAMLTGILDAHHAAGDFVGARAAVRDAGGAITEATAGTTGVDPASGPVDPDLPWNVGSVTKTFVAVVVLQLAEEGRIDLDAGIGQYLPDLAGAEQITPRQLLQHTSGLGEYIDDPVVRADTARVWTPSELIAVAEAAGRVGEPGAAFHYANTNYIVLGEIIEQITGHSWADEIRTRITAPLGLQHTGTMTGVAPAGYVVADGSFVDATTSSDPSIGGAAGALMSTDRDLLTFVTALTDGTLLTPEMWQQMQAFVPGEDYSQFGITHRYGLGIEEYSNGDVTVIGHMGTGEAQTAFVGYDTTTGAAVAVSTNTAVPGPQAFMAIEALTALRQEG